MPKLATGGPTGGDTKENIYTHHYRLLSSSPDLKDTLPREASVKSVPELADSSIRYEILIVCLDVSSRAGYEEEEKETCISLCAPAARQRHYEHTHTHSGIWTGVWGCVCLYVCACVIP